jgi:hypothetical protein
MRVGRVLPNIRKVLDPAAHHANQMSKEWNVHTGLCIWWLANACLASTADARQQLRLEYESKYAEEGKSKAIGYNHCEVEDEAKSVVISEVSSLLVLYHDTISLHESTSPHRYLDYPMTK